MSAIYVIFVTMQNSPGTCLASINSVIIPPSSPYEEVVEDSGGTVGGGEKKLCCEFEWQRKRERGGKGRWRSGGGRGICREKLIICLPGRKLPCLLSFTYLVIHMYVDPFGLQCNTFFTTSTLILQSLVLLWVSIVSSPPGFNQFPSVYLMFVHMVWVYHK